MTRFPRPWHPRPSPVRGPGRCSLGLHHNGWRPGNNGCHVLGLVAGGRDLRELRDRLLPASPAPWAGTPSVGRPQPDRLPHQPVLWRRRRWGEVTGEGVRRRPARLVPGRRRRGGEPTPRSPAWLVARERGSSAGAWPTSLPPLWGTSPRAPRPRAGLTSLARGLRRIRTRISAIEPATSLTRGYVSDMVLCPPRSNARCPPTSPSVSCPGCAGACQALPASSPCAARKPAVAGRRSGSDPTARAAQPDPSTYKFVGHPPRTPGPSRSDWISMPQHAQLEPSHGTDARARAGRVRGDGRASPRTSN